jgi:hypothetical protein
MLRLTDSIRTTRRGSYATDADLQAIKNALATNGDFKKLSRANKEWAYDFLDSLYAKNNQLGSKRYDFYVLAFQCWHETGAFASFYCTVQGNPAGIGIPTGNEDSPWFKEHGKLSPEDAATVYLAEFVIHVEKSNTIPSFLRSDALDFDSLHILKVIALKKDTGWTTVTTINDLCKFVPPHDWVWAHDDDYGIKIQNLANAYLPIPDADNNTQEGNDSSMINIGNRPLRIAVGAGHRNSDGGNTYETAVNGEVTYALLQLIKKSRGFDVRCYTPNEGRGMYPGGLAAAAAVARTWLNDGWGADILHEIHHESTSPSIRGGFVIYPDSAGLSGRNPGNVDIDVREYAGTMAKILVKPFGGVCRYTNCARGMSEKETGVGGDGYRLGVFGAWSEDYFNNNSFQFITEAAAYSNSQDLALMQSPGFVEKEAQGILEMYAALAKARGNWTFDYSIGDASTPVPPTPTVPKAPDGMPFADGLDNGILKIAFGSYIGAAPGNSKFRYLFNPNGPISKAWYTFYKNRGYFPQVENSFVDGQRWYIFFSDGNILWRPNASAPWRFTIPA